MVIIQNWRLLGGYGLTNHSFVFLGFLRVKSPRLTTPTLSYISQIRSRGNDLIDILVTRESVHEILEHD